MVRFLFFEFLGVFEVFVTDGAGGGGADAGTISEFGQTLSHRAQGQNKPRGQTPRSNPANVHEVDLPMST